jgi:hypothetical protein
VPPFPQGNIYNGFRLEVGTGDLVVTTGVGTLTHNGLRFDNQTNRALCVAASPPVGWSNGYPVTANGALSISVAPIAYWHNGLPHAADGSIATAPAGVATYFHGGFCFSSTDRLCTT